MTRNHGWAAALATTLTLVVACESATEPPADATPARLRASVDSLTLRWIGETVRLVASIQDRKGTVVADRVAWRATESTIASVDSSGAVTALRTGLTAAIAESGGMSVTVPVRVIQVPANVQVTIADGPAPAPGREPLLSALGDTLRLTSVVKDQGGTLIPSAEIRWSSADTLVAIVDSSGLVTARRNGTTNVSAAAGPASSGTPVRVQQEITALALDATSIEFTWIGQSRAMIPAARDRLGYGATGVALAWRSSEPLVAVVDSGGTVVAKGAGRATITVKSGTAEASAAVTVTQVPVALKITPGNASLDYLGASVTLAAAVVDKGGAPIPGGSVGWASSAPGAARVDGVGTVVAVAPGKATITATVGQLSGQVEVEVRQVPTALRLLPRELRLFTAAARTGSLSAAVVDRGGSAVLAADPITWRSRSDAVASVSGGVVTPLATGETWVIASSSAFVDSARVTVNGKRFALDSREARIGWTTSVTVTGTYINDASAQVAVTPALTSRKPDIASVAGTRVTGSAAGSAWVVATYLEESDSILVVVESGPGRLELKPANSRRLTGSDVEFSAIAVNNAGVSEDVSGSSTWSVRDTAIAHNAPGLRWIRTERVGSTWVIARNARYGLLDSTRLDVVPGTRFALNADTVRVDWTREARVSATWLEDDLQPLVLSPPLVSRNQDIVAADGAGRIWGLNLGSAWVASEYRHQRDSVFVVVQNGPTRLEASPRDRVLMINTELEFAATLHNASGARQDVSAEWVIRDTTVLKLTRPTYARGLKAGTSWVVGRNVRYDLVDSVQVRVSAVWNGDLVLKTQADVDRVRAMGITEVQNGDLEIIGSSLTTLDGIESIKTVSESVWVDGNASLGSLAGLRVESIGRDLIIKGNPRAHSLTGLGAVTAIRGHFQVYGNPALVIPQFPALRTIAGYFQIRDNGGLSGATPFPVLESVPGGIDFSERAASVTFPALRSADILVRAGGPTEMRFPELTTAGRLVLNDPTTTLLVAPKLVGPTDLELMAVTRMPEIELPALAQGSVTVVDGSIRSVRLPAMKSASTIRVTNNRSLEVLALPALQSVNNLWLQNSGIRQLDWANVEVTSATVDQMPGLTALTLGSTGSASVIVGISYNPVLASVSLPRLAIAQQVQFTGNSVLPTISIPALRTTTQYFTIREHPAMTNLNFMSGMTGRQITGNVGALEIVGNTGLTDIQGMSQLGAAAGSDPIVGRLTITGNTALAAAKITALIATLEARYPGNAFGATTISGNGP